MKRLLSGFAAIGLITLLTPFEAVPATFGAAQQSVGTSHFSAFGTPTVDVLADGKVVITFIVTGDLQGLLTLTLHPGDGGLYVGDWAMIVAYADNTDPVTGIDPELAGDVPGAGPDKGYLRLIHRGALSGSVKDAQVSFDSDGKLTDVFAPLVISQGALEFNNTTGSGRATLAGLTLYF